MAEALWEDAGLHCFDDLRLDIAVDDIGRCWLYRAASQDFVDFKPPEEYNESPNKEKFINVIAHNQREQGKLVPEETKAHYAPDKGVRTKRCGYCQIAWPESYI